MQVWPFVAARIIAVTMSTIHHEQRKALVLLRAGGRDHQRFIRTVCPGGADRPGSGLASLHQREIGFVSLVMTSLVIQMTCPWKEKVPVRKKKMRLAAA